MGNSIGFKVPAGIQCTDWEPVDLKQTGKRCRFYLAPTDQDARGLCQRQTRFTCEEWDRVNPDRVPKPAASPNPAMAPSSAGKGSQTRLPVYLGDPGTPDASSGQPGAKKDVRDPRRLPLRALPHEAGEDVLVSVTAEQVKELENAGVEVKLRSEEPLLGDIWLVSHRTAQKRQELTFREAATLRMIADVFPGARVITIRPVEDYSELDNDLEVPA